MDTGRPARVYAYAHCIISTELDIVKRSLCNLCALALGLTLHVFATQCSVMSPNKDKTAVHCCDPALSVLVMFGVWKRLSRSISLAVIVFTFLFLLADYISCRSYVGRVYRMWSLAVSRFSMPLAMIITRKWIYVFSFLSYIGMGLRSSAINLAFCCCVRNIYLPNVRDLNDKKIETKKWNSSVASHHYYEVNGNDKLGERDR